MATAATTDIDKDDDLSLAVEEPTEPTAEEKEEPVVTAYGYLMEQADLEREAAEVLPGRFDECTYDKGYIRQPLYACLTCTRPPAKYQRKKGTAGEPTQPAGMCYSCSMECHAGHEIIELFAKRHFRCDCGTRVLSAKGEEDGLNACGCQLKQTRTMLSKCENRENTYSHNFWGFYCRCDQYYDPESYEGTMIQCYVCNDWYHDQCIGKMPDEDDYEDYICRECVSKHTVLRHMNASKLAIYGLTDTKRLVDRHELKMVSEDKEEGEPEQKKQKSTNCHLRQNEKATEMDELQPFDLFMKDGWKNHICTCMECKRLMEQGGIQFLINDEDIVEPEEDESRGESLYDAAMKKMDSMDHTRAINAASAYYNMSSKLREYLRPFASSGKVVTNQDIQQFFEQQKGTKSL